MDVDRDPPPFGQLGCQGFIIFDTDGSTAYRSTSSFNQVGAEVTFPEVERKALALADLRGTFPLSSQWRVSGIRPRGSAAARLNGRNGTVVGYDKGRVQIAVDGESPVAVSVANLLPPAPPLRFSVGDVVECCTGSGWVVARVEATWWKHPDSAEEQPAHPYQLRVLGGQQGGALIYAPADHPQLVRAAPPGAAERAGRDGGCGGGGEEGAASLNENAPPAGGAVPTWASPPSVGVSAMNAQHAECDEALRAAARQGTPVALQRARETVAAHFEEEEALFAKHNFNRHNSGAVRGTEGHIGDHARILQLFDVALRDGLARRGGCEAVPASVTRGIAEALDEHVRKHDALYSDFLGSREP